VASLALLFSKLPFEVSDSLVEEVSTLFKGEPVNVQDLILRKEERGFTKVGDVSVLLLQKLPLLLPVFRRLQVLAVLLVDAIGFRVALPVSFVLLIALVCELALVATRPLLGAVHALELLLLLLFLHLQNVLD